MINRPFACTAVSARVQRGVTTLELVIAMSIFALVVGSIYSFLNTAGRSTRVTNDFLQVQAQMRSAIDNLVDEMRWAHSVVIAGTTSVTVLVPQATPFSASSPYTATFAYDAGAQTVTRQVDPDAGGPLAPDAAEPVAYGVVRLDGSAGLSFEYFDATGVSLGSSPADLAGIARVRVSVTTTRDLVSRTSVGDVALRGR